MRDVYVSLGSNIDSEHNIRGGVRALREAFGELLISPVYQTSSVGFDGDDFLNLVVRFSSADTPPALQCTLRAIETRYGRCRAVPRFAARTLDIDLLLCANLSIDRAGLRLPSDEITTHAFVLAPLVAISRGIEHPELGVPFADLWVVMCRDRPTETSAIKRVLFDFFK